MTAEGCRKWRELLGARALEQLPEAERAGLEAHLEGCAECRAELDSLRDVARLLPLADPERIEAAPAPPPALADRVVAAVRAEGRAKRRRRLRFGFATAGAAAAVAAVALVLLVISGGGGESTGDRHVSFASAPADLQIGAKLIPHAYGTEIHMYVKGAPRGALCRVFLRRPDGKRVSAGSFRYRWGEDSSAILSAALDLSRAKAIGVWVGKRLFEEGV
jgi:anti-sigma factor RsiW